MPGQVLDLVKEPGEELDAGIPRVETGPAEAALEGVARVLVLEAAHETREPVDLVLGQVEDLADLAGGAPVAIGDDVRGHGRAPRAVALVDVLDRALAAVAAGQVEVDVGPLAALLGQEALEEQVHPHRIDGGDAQAVANRAVGGRAAALDQDPLAPAEVHDVPDDQEVAGELELADELELALDLPPRLLVVGTIPVAGPLLRRRLQKRELRLPRGDGIVREAVAQVVERELEALGQGLVVAKQRRVVGKERGHGPGRLQVPLRVVREQAAGRLKLPLLANARHHVEERAPPRRRVADAVGGHRAQAQRSGQVEEGLVRRLLLSPPMTLDVEEDAVASEGGEHGRQPVRIGRIAEGLEPGQGHEPVGAAFESVEVEEPLALRHSRLHGRDQLAEVAVALLALDQEGQGPARAIEAQGGAYERPQAHGPCRLEEPRSAAQTVAVHERQGGVTELGRTRDQVLRARGGPQEGEGRSGVELDVHVSLFIRL